MAQVDHVLVAVPDLEQGAADYLLRWGLTALPGGRHPGAGTANLIVPLGGFYLELIAVVDLEEVASNPLGRRVTGALERGETFAGWAVRVDSLDAVHRRLARAGVATTGPREGSRRRADGSLLKWRALHVGDGLEPAIPFFIEWGVPAAAHPGRRPRGYPGGRVELLGLRFASPDPIALAGRLEVITGKLPVEVDEGPVEKLVAVVLDFDQVSHEVR